MHPLEVLVVEPNRRVASDLKETLEKGRRFHVRVISSGKDALVTLNSSKFLPSAILMDRDLEDLPAYTLVKRIRQRTRTAGLPVVIVGGDSTTQDRIEGLEAGVDDFFHGPYTEELPARLQAIIRRRVPPPLKRTANFVGTRIVVDFDRIAVSADGAELNLSRLEYDLLTFFIENEGRVLSLHELVQHVWGRPADGGRRVVVAVARLRSKLGKAGEQISTLKGSGYRFSNDS